MSHSLWGNPAAEGSGDVLRIYTETLLVSLPTPDFSMPYNVICLACTVAALAFGPIHNITTKTLSLVSPEDVEPGLVTKILLKIKSLLRLDKKKPAVSQEKNQETETEKEDNVTKDDEG